MLVVFPYKLKKYILTFGLVCLILNLKSGMCKTCIGREKEIDVSIDELQKLPDNSYTPTNSYRVKEGIKSVTLNCSGRYPPLWEITIGKAYVGKVKVTFHLENDRGFYGNNGFGPSPPICFTTSITLEEFDESITGRYFCTASQFYTDYLYIFGGNDNSTIGSFLQDGQKFQRDIFDFENERNSAYKNRMALPCAQADAKDLVVQYENHHGYRNVCV